MSDRFTSRVAMTTLAWVVIILSVSTQAVAGKQNALDSTVALANELRKGQPATLWETVVDYEAADFLSFVGGDRLLVGSVVSGAKLGVPRHDKMYLYDAKNGRQIWETNRPKIRNGSFTLLTTDPVVLLLGQSGSNRWFFAYSIETGKQIWMVEFTDISRYSISRNMENILLNRVPRRSPSSSDSSSSLHMIDMITGSEIWNLIVPAVMVHEHWRHKQSILLTETGVFVSGNLLMYFDRDSGRNVWAHQLPDLGLSSGRNPQVSDLGISLHGSRGTALLGDGEGVLWVSTVEDLEVVLSTVLDSRVFRVLSTGGEHPELNIQELDAATGEVAWTTPVTGLPVSPLFLEDETLVFTTDGEITGLDTDDGKPRFRTTLPETFSSNPPSARVTVPSPDRLLGWSEQVCVVRELAGVACHSLANGELEWEQTVFSPGDATYSADRLYEVLSRDLPTDRRYTASAASPPKTDSSPFIRNAQRQYESTRERNAAVLRNRDTTRLGRNLAHQSNAMNSRLMAANIRVDMAMGEMQAAADLLNAVVGLQSAIKQAMEIVTIQGVISRKYMELNSYMNLGSSSIYDGYFLSPFKTDGRGLTIVEIDGGTRSDFLFSPVIEPLKIFGLDLAKFAINRHNEKLVTVGVGLDTSKYEKTTKWNYRLPKSSLIAYDLSTLKFAKNSAYKEAVEKKAEELQKEIDEIAAQAAATVAQIAIFTAAQIGNIDTVETMLDSGIDVNTEYPGDTTGPIIFAIIGGQTEMVRFLIEKGADVNQADRDGKTPLFWARQGGHEEIEKILLGAGAN